MKDPLVEKLEAEIRYLSCRICGKSATKGYLGADADTIGLDWTVFLAALTLPARCRAFFPQMR